MIENGTEILLLVDRLRAHGGDFTSIEVKRGSGGCPEVAETLCAFGNMPDGGLIVIGLDESDGFRPVGVADPAAIAQGIASQARSAVVPPVAMTFRTVSVGDAQIVTAKVAGLPATSRPCRTGGRAYLRQADGDYVMSAQEEQQMLALRDRPRYDATGVADTSIADLDADATALFIRNARSTSRRMADADDETVLRRKGVLEANGHRLTLGGLYALGQYPQQFAPNLAVTAAVVTAPGSTDRLIDLSHFDGPISDLLESCMEWLRRNLKSGVRASSDGHNYDHYELPLPALRELVANALVHRDLGPNTQSKRVEIRLREDRLVISNPGGLWGVSRQQLGLPGGKSAVNEHLYDICTLIETRQGARIIEGEGGGIGEAQRALANRKVDPPIFIDKAVSFTAILIRPHTAATSVSSDSELGTEVWMDAPSRVVAALATGSLDKRTIAARCHLTPSQTRYALQKLIANGHVIMNGSWGARNTTYELRTTQTSL